VSSGTIALAGHFYHKKSHGLVTDHGKNQFGQLNREARGVLIFGLEKWIFYCDVINACVLDVPEKEGWRIFSVMLFA
jgi:hypothetical protein